MNKILKKMLIGVGLLIGLLVIVVGVFMYKFNAETSKMTPVETGNVTEDIITIKNDFANMYLIKDSTNYIAIDAGKDLNVVEAELKKLKIDPSKIEAVLLTHSDMDHVAGLPLFTKAKLYMARNEEKMLTEKNKKCQVIITALAEKTMFLWTTNKP